MNTSTSSRFVPILPQHRFSFGHMRALPTLAASRLFAFTASSMIGIFLPIFLYEFFHQSIQFVFVFYLINELMKIPFYVPGAMIFSRIGLTKSMIIGVFGLALFYLMFFLIGNIHSTHPYILMGVALTGGLLVSILYWSPFHIDFAEFSNKEKRGQQVGLMLALQQILAVTAPLLSGFLIMFYGYPVTFFLGLILVLISIIPLFYLPKTTVQFEFGYWESFQKLFSKKFRSMSYSMAAFGAEDMVGAVAWPIFLFMIFHGNYFNIGVFSAVILLLTFIFQLFIGKATDKISAKRMLRVGTLIYAAGWIWKGFVQTIFGVFAASTFHCLGSICLETPMGSLTYQQAADAGHYIDEYTVLREMAMCIGRASMFLFLLVLSLHFSITISFFVAAAISLGINRLSAMMNL